MTEPGNYTPNRSAGNGLSTDRQAEMGAEAVLEKHRVPRRQRARRIVRPDLQHEQARTLGSPVQLGAQCGNRPQIGCRARLRESAGSSERREIDAAAGVAFLHAGLAETAV